MHTARNAVREAGVRYKRHQPELTLLYQIIETYYPEFLDYMESQSKALPTHILESFKFQYLILLILRPLTRVDSITIDMPCQVA